MRTILASLLVLGLAAAAPAQSQKGPIRPPQDKPAPPQPFGTIRAHVQDAKGVAVVGALVRLEKLNRAHETGETGDVLLGWVPVGSHELTVSKAGFAPAKVAVAVEQDGITVVTVSLKASAEADAK